MPPLYIILSFLDITLNEPSLSWMMIGEHLLGKEVVRGFGELGSLWVREGMGWVEFGCVTIDWSEKEWNSKLLERELGFRFSLLGLTAIYSKNSFLIRDCGILLYKCYKLEKFYAAVSFNFEGKIKI
jgi:hypothetical protein